MKEITEVLKVQITAIKRMDDEKAKDWEKNRDAKIQKFLAGMAEDMGLDDVQLMDGKIFIRDVEEV